VAAEIRTYPLSNRAWYIVSLSAGNWNVTSHIIPDVCHCFGDKVSDSILKKPEDESSTFI
jgi:hypothetical protein